MISAPTKCELVRLPNIADVLATPEPNRILHFRFHLGGLEWFVAGYSPPGELLVYRDFKNLFANPRWMTETLDALKNKRIHGRELENDLYWRPIRFADRPINLLDIALPYLTLTCASCGRRMRENLQLIVAWHMVNAEGTPCCGAGGRFAEKATVRHVKGLLKAAHAAQKKAVR